MKHAYLLLFFFALSLLSLPLLAGSLTTTGTTVDGPIWNRPVVGVPPRPPLSNDGTAVRYSTVQFNVDVSGSYTFQSTAVSPAEWDNFTFLYQNAFDPTAPFSNVIVGNDDNPTIGLSGFTINLTAGVTYILVVTGYDNRDFGSWSTAISGPGTPVFVSGVGSCNGQFAGITQQPPSGTAVCQTSTVSIPLSASGTVISYQLYHSSGPVSATQATNTFTLTNVQPSQSDSYSVVVIGACNSVTSTAFDLTVTTPVPLNLSNDGPLNCTKTTATLTATPTVQGQYTYAFSTSAVQSGATNTATVSQTGVYSVTLTSAGECFSTANTTVTATQTPPSPFVATQSTPDGLVVQISGGVAYERLKTIDRINGYEIRQTEQNRTGYFVITQPGPYSITVIGANGCRATVTGTR